MDTASNVGAQHRLPEQIHVLVKDDVTGLKIGSFVGIEYLDDGTGRFISTRTAISILRDGIPIKVIAEKLLSDCPGTALVCDKAIAEELKAEEGVVTWLEDDHCQLVGVGKGTLEVYVRYDSANYNGTLPPGVVGLQKYL
ncbi:MAG: hypothetical protein AAB508_05155 [Patescibacteria group bacterium]